MSHLGLDLMVLLLPLVEDLTDLQFQRLLLRFGLQRRLLPLPDVSLDLMMFLVVWGRPDLHLQRRAAIAQEHRGAADHRLPRRC